MYIYKVFLNFKDHKFMCGPHDLIIFSLRPPQNRNCQSVPVTRLQKSVYREGQVTVIEREGKTLLLRLNVASGK
jgi:hypothetical protein